MEERKKRSFVRLGAIEIGILVLLIIAVLSIFVYFRIIPIPSFISNIATLHAPTPTATSSVIPTISSNQPVHDSSGNIFADVSLGSSFPNYSVAFVDKQGLLKQLLTWGIYGKTYTHIRGKPDWGTSSAPITKVDLELSPNLQPLIPLTVKNNTLTSSNIHIANGVITVTVYLGPGALPHAGYIFELQALRTLAYVTNPVSMDFAKKFNSEFNDYMYQKDKTHVVFLQVVKK